MPVISMFYGIIVMMYFFDDEQHKRPHIHVATKDKKHRLPSTMVPVWQAPFRRRNYAWFRLG